MGFKQVHDLIGGRAAWTALGLPTEGEIGDRHRISHHVAKGGVLLGAIDPAAGSLPPETPVERVMVPAPGTIRPEMRIEEVVEQLRSDGLDHVFVTAVNGVLEGLVVTDELHV